MSPTPISRDSLESQPPISISSDSSPHPVIFNALTSTLLVLIIFLSIVLLAVGVKYFVFPRLRRRSKPVLGYSLSAIEVGAHPASYLPPSTQSGCTFITGPLTSFLAESADKLKSMEQEKEFIEETTSEIISNRAGEVTSTSGNDTESVGETTHDKVVDISENHTKANLAKLFTENFMDSYEEDGDDSQDDQDSLRDFLGELASVGPSRSPLAGDFKYDEEISQTSLGATQSVLCSDFQVDDSSCNLSAGGCESVLPVIIITPPASSNVSLELQTGLIDGAYKNEDDILEVPLARHNPFSNFRSGSLTPIRSRREATMFSAVPLAPHHDPSRVECWSYQWERYYANLKETSASLSSSPTQSAPPRKRSTFGSRKKAVRTRLSQIIEEHSSASPTSDKENADPATPPRVSWKPRDAASFMTPPSRKLMNMGSYWSPDTP